MEEQVLKSNFIEKIVEEKVKNSDNNFENTYHLTFNQENFSDKTITLSGEGSLKILLPV